MLLIRLELIWVLFLSRNQYLHTGNAAMCMGRDKLDWVVGGEASTVGLCSVTFISANNFLSGQYRIAGPIHPLQKNPSIYREVDLHLYTEKCELPAKEPMFLVYAIKKSSSRNFKSEQS